MTLVRHEWKQSRTSLAIWTSSIAALLAICVFLFPEMKAQMSTVSSLFASMGAFTAAFGMDRLNFGALDGYYAVECGNILGLGGALFAALCAVNMLSKEERGRTAEFLLTHPVRRARVVSEKLLAVLIQIAVMDLVIYAVAVGSIAAIGESVPWREINLLHLAYALMQLEIAGICFGLSAFLRRGGLGLGLGIAAMMYFLNLIANIAKSAAFLKYVTPFGFCDAADIMTRGSLDWPKVAVGMAICAVGIAAAYWEYGQKDIR